MKVVMYCTAMCPYCVQAEMLLLKKGVQISKIRIDQEPAMYKEMLTLTNGMRSVPQIFIGEKHVGGFDDLYEMDVEGNLDPLLQI